MVTNETAAEDNDMPNKYAVPCPGRRHGQYLVYFFGSVSINGILLRGIRRRIWPEISQECLFVLVRDSQYKFKIRKQPLNARN